MLQKIACGDIGQGQVGTGEMHKNLIKEHIAEILENGKRLQRLSDQKIVALAEALTRL